MKFSVERPQDVFCERCTRLVCRIVQGQIQLKSGKQVASFPGPASISCWHCAHTNLIGIRHDAAPVMNGKLAMASS